MQRTSPILRAIVVVAAVAFLVALTIANFRYSIDSPGGNDFLARWNGARYWLVEGTSPYDSEVSQTAQELIYGRPAVREQGEDVAHFVYPLPSMIFFGPFGYLQYDVARAIWMTVLEVGLPLLAILGIRLSRWKPSRPMLVMTLLYSILWYHGLRSVIVGQFAVIESLLMVGGLLAIDKNQDWLAGLLFALSISKPQMAFLLIPYVLLWCGRARRWSVVWTTISLIVMLFIVFSFIEPGWIIGWLRQVVDYTSYTALGSPISIVADLVASGDTVTFISYGLSAMAVFYLLYEWLVSLGKPFQWFLWTASMTIVITNLVATRTATTNYVVLLPVLLLVFSTWQSRWGRSGTLAVALILMVTFVGLWLLFWVTVEGNMESHWMYLPLPFVALLGLWWIRWWIIRIPLDNDRARILPHSTPKLSL
jgi:hypothetical protein